MPLPALLRHMSAVVSLSSGVAVEASMFGVPSIFLSDVARQTFADLIERGLAAVVDVDAIHEHIARMDRRPARPPRDDAPDIGETLRQLEELAVAYRRACAAAN